MSNPHDIIDIIRQARARMSQRELGALLGVDAKTIGRWEREEVTPSPLLLEGIKQAIHAATPAPSALAPPSDFTFIDLFAGIGGIRTGFEAAGGRCVFTSEWNAFAQKTYAANFADTHPIHGDITKIDVKDIPDHDVLVGGFPCQPFSIAGVSKKNSMGRQHGFSDTTQGTLFFDVARIIDAKRPKAFMLENVKNLLSHDGGKTFKIIKETLEVELGYKISYKVIDGQHFVPQHRERILIVGFREDTDFTFDEFKAPAIGPKLSSILHPQNGSEKISDPFIVGSKGKVAPKYTLTPNLWAYLQAYAAKHKAAGNGFGFGLVDKNSVTRTLSARYYKDGSEILVSQGKNKTPRRLTPRECARLMGFPDSFKIPVSDTQAYKQFGNSVVVPVMAAVAMMMRPRIMTLIKNDASSKKAKKNPAKTTKAASLTKDAKTK
jgi:DNA (cytosine-5)-methyltransferase 1